MTDAPKMPPFPEKPEHMPGLWWEYYYRDLAAAWEQRARVLHKAVSEIANGAVRDNDPNCVDDALCYQDIENVARFALVDCGPLPPKEG